MSLIFRHFLRLIRVLLALVVGLCIALPASARTDSFGKGLAHIQHRWAVASYLESGRRQPEAFDRLLADTRSLSVAFPDRPEAHVWHGIVASSYANVAGPLRALRLAKEARDELEQAVSLDGSVLGGSAYSALGALYTKAPGGVVGLGSRRLAREYLEKALAVNPADIDANYYYAVLLFEQAEYAAAHSALLAAASAPARNGRPLADRGRHAEINALLSQVRHNLATGG